MGPTCLTVDGRDPALLKATRTTKKPAAKKMSSIGRGRVKKATWPTLDWKGELFRLYLFQAYHRFSSRTETFHFVHDAVQSTTDFLLCSDLEILHIPSTLPSWQNNSLSFEANMSLKMKVVFYKSSTDMMDFLHALHRTVPTTLKTRTVSVLII